MPFRADQRQCTNCERLVLAVRETESGVAPVVECSYRRHLGVRLAGASGWAYADEPWHCLRSGSPTQPVPREPTAEPTTSPLLGRDDAEDPRVRL